MKTYPPKRENAIFDPKAELHMFDSDYPLALRQQWHEFFEQQCVLYMGFVLWRTGDDWQGPWHKWIWFRLCAKMERWLRRRIKL